MNQTTARHAKDSSAACPQCGARRAPGVAWCTQCFAVLESEDTDGPRQAPVSTLPSEVVDRIRMVDFEELSSWDVAQREAASLSEEEREARLNDALAELQSTRDPRSGALSRLGSFGGTVLGKVVIIGGGGALLFGLLYGLMALVGVLL